MEFNTDSSIFEQMQALRTERNAAMVELGIIKAQEGKWIIRTQVDKKFVDRLTTHLRLKHIRTQICRTSGLIRTINDELIWLNALQEQQQQDELIDAALAALLPPAAASSLSAAVIDFDDMWSVITSQPADVVDSQQQRDQLDAILADLI